MAFDKETAARLESRYQQHLDEAFQGTFTFDPITVEVTQNMFDDDAFHVTVAYHGDGRLLDPAKLNRISSLMVDEATELGIENTIIESYVDSREYDGDVARVEQPLEEISGNQDWHGMLNIPPRFLNAGTLPNEAELSTAVDRSYFALYHALCHNNARALAGTPGNGAPTTGPGSTWAWKRAPSRHGSGSTGPKPPTRCTNSAPPSPSSRNTGTGPWNLQPQPFTSRR